MEAMKSYSKIREIPDHNRISTGKEEKHQMEITG
jgi:hypothetical protein